MAGPDVDREHVLSRTFVRLADTLVSGFDLVELFDDLVTSSMEIFDLAAAGLMLADSTGHLRVMASSSEAARLVDVMELQGDEGPCVEAYRRGEPVMVEDPNEQARRWPTITDGMRELGLGPAYAVPMRLRDQTIGAMNLFRPPERPMPVGDLVTAQSLADVATIAILQVRAARATLELAEQLQAALNSRVIIEQAKGVLSEYGRVDMAIAFAALRGYARSHNRRLSEVAEALASGRLRPERVIDRDDGPE
jgi:GAF domain-containing protein